MCVHTQEKKKTPKTQNPKQKKPFLAETILASYELTAMGLEEGVQQEQVMQYSSSHVFFFFFFFFFLPSSSSSSQCWVELSKMVIVLEDGKVIISTWLEDDGGLLSKLCGSE
jgi:hypothetical protein